MYLPSPVMMNLISKEENLVLKCFKGEHDLISTYKTCQSPPPPPTHMCSYFHYAWHLKVVFFIIGVLCFIADSTTLI